MNVLVLVLALAGSLGAGDIPPSPVTAGTDATTCQFPSVVSLRLGDGTTFCSGSLVHPQVVLTAGHCVEPQTGMTPSSIAFGENAASPAAVASVQACTWHPDYEIIAVPDQVTDVKNDVAFCVLTAPVEGVPTVPIVMGCEADELQPDAAVTVVGFGASMGGIMDGMLWHSGSGSKRFTEQTLESVDLAEGNILMVGDGANSVCFGDSGGPSMIQLDDGTWRILGVGSTLHPDSYQSCGPGAVYQAVHPHVAWLEEASGFDVTPCFEADGTWAPSEGCGGFPLDPTDTTGAWANGCATENVAGPSATCGEPQGGGESTGGGTSTDDGGSAESADETDAGSGEVDGGSTSQTSGDDGSGSDGGGTDGAGDPGETDGGGGCGCAARGTGAGPLVLFVLLFGRPFVRRRVAARMA